MATPLLGWITPALRTNDQNVAHAAAEAAMPRFALAPQTLAKGDKICLYDAWRHPTVVADVGFVFPRFHQLTGSCVGAGWGQADFTVIAVQRLLAQNPTKAFIPFWPFNYGRCRFLEGDRGQGEGAMGSSIAAQCSSEGQFDAGQSGLPAFKNTDGLVLTTQLEYQWSDGASAIVTKWLPTAKPHTIGSAARLYDVQGIKTAIMNGYPVTFACDNYIGNASVQGSGADACVVGYWDGRGGHQQSIHAVWEHPTLGPLYWAQNNWPKETYPADPAGGPVCGCWVTESHVTAAMRLNSEVYALSNLNWFPAQPVTPDTFSWD